MIYDAHVHIGQFYDIYSTPKQVVDFLLHIGVEKFAVSSTTICEENYEKVYQEMIDIVHIGSNHVIPVLWICPNMLLNGWLQKMLNSGIEWRCLKVHGFLHDWHTDNTLLPRVINLAREKQLPLLFHTGGTKESDAGAYHAIIRYNPDVKFILAHSRPIEQTLSILKECPNAYADTAFTPMEHVKQIIDGGFEDRLLFGTDYPIPNYYYPTIPSTDYYTQFVESTQAVMSSTAWEKVAHDNFEKLFNH